MNPKPGRDPYPLPNLTLTRERNYTVWRALALTTGTWCLILLGVVGWIIIAGGPSEWSNR